MAKKTTFIEITNEDIYNAIREFKDSNRAEHQAILIHQKETNGKVKLNKWMATTCLMLILFILGKAIVL